MKIVLIAATLIFISLTMSTNCWIAVGSETRYNLINYYGPRAEGSIWFYSGRDWDGDPAFTRLQVISENQRITSYTGGNAAIPYETNVISIRCDFGTISQDGFFYSYDDWNEYQTISDGFCLWGDDDDGDFIRVDGGLNFGDSLAMGETTTTSAPGYSGGVYIGEFNASISLLGIETITVPAGTFQNCLHLRFSINDEQTHDEWWCQGVGIVKMAGISGEGSGRLRELESWESPNKETFYRDFDGDGYGDPEFPYENVSQPSGYVTNDSDCNDYDSSIHPGAAEIRGDGIDQDCNGNDLPVIYDNRLTQTQVSQLYVSIFGRASEGEGNSYWQTIQGDMTAVANAMLATGAAQDYFGTTLDDDQAFIEFIYENTLGKTYAEDPDGIDYWVGELASGKSKGQVVSSLIDAAMDPKYAGLAAQNQFLNKVTVCSYTAETVYTCPNADDLSAFVGVISSVTDDPVTIVTAKSVVDTF